MLSGLLKIFTMRAKSSSLVLPTLSPAAAPSTLVDRPPSQHFSSTMNMYQCPIQLPTTTILLSASPDGYQKLFMAIDQIEGVLQAASGHRLTFRACKDPFPYFATDYDPSWKDGAVNMVTIRQPLLHTFEGQGQLFAIGSLSFALSNGVPKRIPTILLHVVRNRVVQLFQEALDGQRLDNLIVNVSYGEELLWTLTIPRGSLAVEANQTQTLLTISLFLVSHGWNVQLQGGDQQQWSFRVVKPNGPDPANATGDHAPAGDGAAHALDDPAQEAPTGDGAGQGAPPAPLPQAAGDGAAHALDDPAQGAPAGDGAGHGAPPAPLPQAAGDGAAHALDDPAQEAPTGDGAGQGAPPAPLPQAAGDGAAHALDDPAQGAPAGDGAGHGAPPAPLPQAAGDGAAHALDDPAQEAPTGDGAGQGAPPAPLPQAAGDGAAHALDDPAQGAPAGDGAGHGAPPAPLPQAAGDGAAQGAPAGDGAGQGAPPAQAAGAGAGHGVPPAAAPQPAGVGAHAINNPAPPPGGQVAGQGAPPGAPAPAPPVVGVVARRWIDIEDFVAFVLRRSSQIQKLTNNSKTLHPSMAVIHIASAAQAMLDTITDLGYAGIESEDFLVVRRFFDPPGGGQPPQSTPVYVANNFRTSTIALPTKSMNHDIYAKCVIYRWVGTYHFVKETRPAGDARVTNRTFVFSDMILVQFGFDGTAAKTGAKDIIVCCNRTLCALVNRQGSVYSASRQTLTAAGKIHGPPDFQIPHVCNYECIPSDGDVLAIMKA
ncbi:hypothetical protein LXA43DRAFT_1167587 [Ganoderma leucocontextum]|nr:hypothetical protein LXA43DRAFT_1167587 [Ganoderma leucocontextum]